MRQPNDSSTVAEQLNLNPYPALSPITVDTGYELTKDPFAILSFALLVFTIVAFLFLLTVTARLSSIEVWDFVRHGQRHRRIKNLESPPEDTVPLISSSQTANRSSRKGQKAKVKEPPRTQAKTVRFSERFDFKTIPAAPDAFDKVYEEWQNLNPSWSKACPSKRQSVSDRQFAELHLGSS